MNGINIRERRRKHEIKKEEKEQDYIYFIEPGGKLECYFTLNKSKEHTLITSVN